MATRESTTAGFANPRRRSRWPAVLAIVALVAVVGYGAVCYVVYDGVGRPAPGGCHESDLANTPDAFAIPKAYDPALASTYRMPVPQDVVFHSRDPQMPDADLAGWWIPAADPAAPAVVVVHGIQSCRREASVLLGAGMLHRHGYSVLLMDLRDSGDSEGDDARFAAGTEEYLDVLGAWDWLVAQGVPTSRIGLLGYSFGSATTMIAGGQEPQAQAVWVDSGFPRIQPALDEFLQDHSPFPAPLSTLIVPGAALWARIIAGDDLLRYNPVEEVARFGGRSIAFVHGGADATLPASWATELRDAAIGAGASSPEVWVVPNAGHTEAIYLEPAEYETRLTSFFGTALGWEGY